MSRSMERFYDDPTDIRASSEFFEETRAIAHLALSNGEVEKYWVLAQQMKFVGKFLPVSDTRNPDNEIYCTHHDNRSE